jgi:hypothetical protein
LQQKKQAIHVFSAKQFYGLKESSFWKGAFSRNKSLTTETRACIEERSGIKFDELS